MILGKMISTTFDSAKRMILKFKGFGDRTEEIPTVAPYGFEGHPIKDAVIVYSPTQVNGQSVVLGVINKDLLTALGESRQFSTDENGVMKMWLHCKNDGTAEFGGNTKNLVRYQELETGFNQLKSDFNSFISTYNSHVHPSPAGGSTGPTPASGSPTTADIAAAKIDEIKTL